MDSKNEEKKDDSSKGILLSILAITILVILVISFSFAAYIKAEKSKNSNKISTGNISMNYTEDTNGISIKDALPTSDTVGKQLKGEGEYFDFTINSTMLGNVSINYEIAAIKDESSTIADSDIRLYLEQQVSGSYEEVMAPSEYIPIKNRSDIGSPEGSMILKTVKKTKTTSDNYRLRIWLAENSTVDIGKSYAVKINVYGKAS